MKNTVMKYYVREWLRYQHSVCMCFVWVCILSPYSLIVITSSSRSLSVEHHSTLLCWSGPLWSPSRPSLGPRGTVTMGSLTKCSIVLHAVIAPAQKEGRLSPRPGSGSFLSFFLPSFLPQSHSLPTPQLCPGQGGSRAAKAVWCFISKIERNTADYVHSIYSISRCLWPVHFTGILYCCFISCLTVNH